VTLHEPVYLHNGRFITIRGPSPVKGVIIHHGVIERLVRSAGPASQNIKRIDLNGAYVIPGFIDSHTHLIARGIELQRIDLASCRSLDSCLEKLRDARSKHTTLLFGSNYDETTWSDYPRMKMTRATLDKISASIPVIMRRVCGHFAIVNTAALKKIPRDWTVIDRRHGHVYKRAALHLNEVFPPRDAEMMRAILMGMQEAVQNGITSVHEISNIERFGMLQDLHARGKLRLRFSLYLLHSYFDRLWKAGVRAGFGDDMLRLAGIKLFLDGSVGARTAAFSKPYRGTRCSGAVTISRRVLAGIIARAEHRGYQLMIHALGDRAVAQAVQSLQSHIGGTNLLRHRMEHVELIDEGSMRIMARKHICASMQPNFVRRWQIPNGLYERHLGERYQRMNCFRNMLGAGIRVAFGSDCMPTGPLYGMQGAYAHPFPCGRISRRTALNMYTQAGAFLAHDEKKKGSIKQGFYADMVMLDGDPLDPGATRTPRVLMTMVGGIPVYRRTARS
jgi:predicted amidohydrolase YtcJ